MRVFAIAFLPVLFFLFPALVSAADSYYCPMRCEGEKVYAGPGNCPVCGMNLEKLAEGSGGSRPLNTRDYRMELGAEPPTVQAGAPTKLVFTPRRTKDNSVVKGLEVIHEHPMHVFVVSQDLSFFAHEHPDLQTNGSLSLSFIFPKAGNYILYADITPRGERNQLFPLALQVAGKPEKEIRLREIKGPWKQKDYTVSLDIVPSAVSTKPVELRLLFKKGGRKLTDLEPLLGSLGHAIVISKDTTQFVHAHPPPLTALPKSFGPGLTFHAVFPKPGLYKAWFQTKHQGQVLTADFVVNIK